MQGLIEEGQEQLESDEEGPTKDVGISGAALRVEHYEIAGYTAAIAIAQQLGHDEIVSLLTENLEEEQAASEKVQAQAQSPIGEASSESEDNEVSEEDEDEEEAVTTGGRSRAGSDSTRTKRSTRVRHMKQHNGPGRTGPICLLRRRWQLNRRISMARPSPTCNPSIPPLTAKPIRKDSEPRHKDDPANLDSSRERFTCSVSIRSERGEPIVPAAS